MPDNVIQIRDYQNKRDIERLYAELKKYVDTAPSELNPDYQGEGIDGIPFVASEDPA